MIDGLKPYPAMKDSGVEWLGEVPAHWEILPPKRVMRLRSSGAAPIKNTASPDPREGYAPAFSASGQDVWLPEPMFHGPGLVLSAVGAHCGKTFRADGAWAIVANTHVLLVKDGNHRDYWWYITNDENWWARAGSAQPFVQVGKTLDRPWAVPPPPEQAAIVRYLDYVDRRVRRLVRAKRRLIALLTEQKQAIIHRAVTRGLDPDVPLKDSGVEWLGQVPAHWEVWRLKFLVKEAVAGPYGSSLTKSMYTSAGYRVYGQQQVIPDDFSVGDYYISEARFQEFRRYQVHPGDLLVSVMGTVGKVAVVPETAEPGIINPRLVRYRPDLRKVRPRYVQLTMLSPATHAQLTESAKGTTMEGLNMQILGRVVLAIPPLDAQDTILAAVAHETHRIDGAIDAAQLHLHYMDEYRTRLIADVVTGKLDVREAAAALPEVDPLAEDGMDDAPDADTEAGLGNRDTTLEEAEA